MLVFSLFAMFFFPTSEHLPLLCWCSFLLETLKICTQCFTTPFYKRIFFIQKWRQCTHFVWPWLCQWRGLVFSKGVVVHSMHYNLHYSYAKQKKFNVCFMHYIIAVVIGAEKNVLCVKITNCNKVCMDYILKCLHFQQKSSLFWPGAIKGSPIFEMWARVRGPHWHTVRFWCVRKSFGHLWFLLKVYISYMKTILNICKFSKHKWSPLLNIVAFE